MPIPEPDVGKYEAPTALRLDDGRWCLFLDYYGVRGAGQGFLTARVYGVKRIQHIVLKRFSFGTSRLRQFFQCYSRRFQNAFIKPLAHRRALLEFPHVALGKTELKAFADKLLKRNK